jgi:radical SAM superfamily enzyme YgiQ (UPF0313 family)
MIKKLLLFYPSMKPDFPGIDIQLEIPSIPIGLMSLGTFIQNNGFEVKIIDSRIFPKKKAQDLLLSEINAECLIGFSVTTSQLKHAYNLSKLIKNINPHSLIVWGGIHPTLYPEQTIKCDYIDFLMYGEAEFGLLKLLNELNKNKPDFSKVNNLVFKENGNIIRNKIECIFDTNQLPLPNYSLLEVESYINREIYFYGMNTPVRTLDISSSRGCPYRCSFCTNNIEGFRKWRPFSAEQIIELIDSLVPKYNLNHIWFMDDFFFGDKKRAIKIIEHINNNYKITWEANARANIFNSFFNQNLLELLQKSGCVQLRMGIESGSPKVLNILKKDILPEDAIKANIICLKYNIRPSLFFMGGIPGESKKDFNQTIDLMYKLKKNNYNSVIAGPGLFRPYPGTELYEECKKLGFIEPKTIEDWLSFELTSNFGVDSKYIKWTNFSADVINAEYVMFNFNYGYSHLSCNKKLSLVRKILYYLAILRIKTHFYKIPAEKYLSKIYNRLKLKILMFIR